MVTLRCKREGYFTWRTPQSFEGHKFTICARLLHFWGQGGEEAVFFSAVKFSFGHQQRGFSRLWSVERFRVEAISLSAAKSLVIVGALSPDGAAITEPDQAPSHLPGTSMCTLLKRTVRLQKESTPLQQKIWEVTCCDAREPCLSSLTATWGGVTNGDNPEGAQTKRSY